MPGSLSAGLSGRFAPQFFPRLAGVAALFARFPTAASLWVHLLAVNVFAARGELLAARGVAGWRLHGGEALAQQPAAVTALLIVLIATTGPVGLAAAAAVRGWRWWVGRQG